MEKYYPYNIPAFKEELKKKLINKFPVFPVFPVNNTNVSTNVSNAANSPVKIRFISWNMGENKKNLNQWSFALQKWDLIQKLDYDILIVTLQEDFNNLSKFGKFLSAIDNFLNRENFTKFQESLLGPPEITGSPFSIKISVFVKKNLNPIFDKKEKTCVQYMLPKKISKAVSPLKLSFMPCTKGTVGISLFLNDIQLIFMGSHLPLVSSKKDLGFEERLDAIKQSTEKVLNKLLNNRNNPFIVIWGGDFNFRQNTLARNQTVDEQLKFAMTQNLAFEGFEEQELEFPPTCKLLECLSNGDNGKDSCSLCRTKSIEDFDKTCYYETSGKSPRNPSYCDRILYKYENVKFIPISYNSWSKGSSGIFNSDHNLVYADFNLYIKSSRFYE